MEKSQGHAKLTLKNVLDQLHADNLALRVMTMRMWGYFALVDDNPHAFIAAQRQQSLQSVDMWKIEGHPDPENLRRLARETVNRAFDGIVQAGASMFPLQ
jgi:hypothetical protein